jgi:hypothetical protein
MVSGIRWFPGSGAVGNTVAILYAAGRATPSHEILSLVAGNSLVPSRLGFFGSAGAPNSAIIVGQYQERTHRVDADGVDYGQFIDVKYTGASTAEVSGVSITVTGHALEEIPQESGTLLCRFTEPNGTAVITQNAKFRCIDLTAASGAPDVTTGGAVTNLTVQAAQLDDNAGNTGDTSWTQIDSGGALELALADQSDLAHVHDYHLIVSVSPAVAGRKIDFGFYLQLEFL